MTLEVQTDALVRLSNAYPPRWTKDHSAAFTMPGYTVEVHLRRPDRLVVSFDPRTDNYLPSQSRKSWAHEFLKKRQLSAVEIKPDQSCWYRGEVLSDFLRTTKESGLFAAFDTVMNYGGSMGGFGALSFANLTEADVCLALNPQANLGPSVRDWEPRFQEALAQNWDGQLCNLSVQTRDVGLTAVVYDPYHTLDRRQVDLIDNPTMTRLHVPFVGHRIPAHLNTLGILRPLFAMALARTIDLSWFAGAVRNRRTLLRYRNEMLRRTADNPTRHERLLRLLPPEEQALGAR